MEWTEMILPLASSFAIVTAAMPLFIGYFQMKKIRTRDSRRRAKMAQCQSWHSYNGRLRIFDCGIDHSSLGWRMAKAVDRIAVHFVIYYLGFMVRLDSWTISSKFSRNATWV